MKILVIGDVHFCTYSSLVRLRGEKFSVRLENLINSVNWAENISKERNCDAVIYLGDFFDKPDCTSEEISALQQINWNNHCHHIFLVGNHEASNASLEYNSTNVFNLASFNVVSEPSTYQLPESTTQLAFLPYIVSDKIESINSYFGERCDSVKRIIFSHNDVKGIQMGSFVSKFGLELDDIKNNCDLFLNGHLHNEGRICDHGYNVGNLTGLNFSEDALKYKHKIILLDTDSLLFEEIINPFAFNFVSCDYSKELIDKIKTLPNLVLSLNCLGSVDDVKIILNNIPNIITYRITQKTTLSSNTSPVNDVKDLKFDHLKMFYNFMKDHYSSPFLEDELQAIMG